MQQSKWRRWNDNCTGRTGSHGEASPLEPAASSEQAAAKAGQMATKRKREPLELSPAEAERRSKKAEAERRRREEIKNAGGPVLYRALREASKQRKLSQLSAEEAAKVLKKKAYNEQYYAEAKTAGGKAEAAALREASKKRKLSQLSAEEAAKVLKQRAYNQQYYAEAKTAGGKARFAERKAARIARKAAREACKARKARAKARAKAWCGPIDPFDMAARVQTALQLPGMVLACLQSLASSAGRVQKWAQFVGNHGKTPKAERKRVAAWDMEGHVKTHPPYSASLVGLGPAENWFMNPLQNGVLSTVRECQVCPKP